MGGLDYLNKKVWHPGSMKNIQKVWEEQQKQKEINKKGKQRAKKLQQERHNQQLKRIQVEAGLIPKSHLDRMEWMYDWGNKLQQQKTNQEFLTGQKKADPHARKQFKHVFQQEITNTKCEDFALLHEDPLFAIQKQQKQRREAIVNNPFQMKKIIKEIQTDYLPKRESDNSTTHKKTKKHKKEKKEKKSKKHKKEKKQKKQKKQRKREQSRSSSSMSPSRSSSSSSSSSESERERSRSKKRSHHDFESESGSSDKKSHKQSKLYQQYLKQRYGGMLKKQQDGSLKVDYGIHRKKYKTQFQLNELERRQKLEELRNNAYLLKEQRQNDRKHYKKQQQSDKEEKDYQQGVNNIRQKMYSTVKENRNLKQYKDEQYERE